MITAIVNGQELIPKTTCDEHLGAVWPSAAS